MTTTKVEFLLILIHKVKETLISIQRERFDVNVDERPLKAKKKITDENFQKLIKLKNEDFNTILAIQNEILALDAEENLHTYMTKDVETQINTLNKCFDQTFAVVDQMKRETEFIENTSTEDESFTMTPIKSDDLGRDKNESSSSCGDSNSNYEALTQDHRSNNDYIKEVFGKPLTKALAAVIQYQPNDPIGYLAKFLHNYRENELSENNSSF